MFKRKLARTLVVLGILLAISACALNAPAGRASITDDEARRMAETALTALNETNYESFVENFGEKLSEAMTEVKFLELRDTLKEISGMFLSLTGPKLVKANSPDAVGYIYICKFEKEEVVLTHYYLIDGDKVEGFFVNSPNLRKVSQ